jgi:hypothetical protein
MRLSVTFLIVRREMQRSLHVKQPLFLSDFNKTWIFSTEFEKSSNIKFNENPTRGSRVIPRGRTDLKMLRVAFLNFEDALKNDKFTELCPQQQ